MMKEYLYDRSSPNINININHSDLGDNGYHCIHIEKTPNIQYHNDKILQSIIITFDK